jgi:hypothetical protein
VRVSDLSVHTAGEGIRVMLCPAHRNERVSLSRCSSIGLHVLSNTYGVKYSDRDTIQGGGASGCRIGLLMNNQCGAFTMWDVAINDGVLQMALFG